MSDKQTQCKRIVAYIREKGCITSLEAYQKLNVTQLAARITDLESAGFVFVKPRRKDMGSIPAGVRLYAGGRRYQGARGFGAVGRGCERGWK